MAVDPLFSPSGISSPNPPLFMGELGSVNCCAKIPSVVQSFPKGGQTYPSKFGPLFECSSIPLKGYVSCISPVKFLSSWGCPSYIAGFIISIYIYPVQTHGRIRTLTYVFKKFLKGVKFWMNYYTPTSILGPLFSIWIGTSGSHINPSYMFFSACSTMFYHSRRLSELVGVCNG